MIRSLAVLLASTAALALCGPALAQMPGAPMPGAQAPGAAPPAAPMPPAGQVPPAAQPTMTPGTSDQEPALAPGATGDQGKVMPSSNDNAGTTTVYAPAKPDADVKWPCVQPKVSSISAGTIWAGPNVDEGKDWDQDNDLAALAQKLASRRTTIEEAGPLVDDFAKKAGADKDKQLTKLFVGVLDITNDNRDKILQGIMRYAKGQDRLADRMRDEADKISQMQDTEVGNSGIAAQQKNTEFAWDKRIFQERKQALSFVCDTPSLLERRVYQIGKIIQAQL